MKKGQQIPKAKRLAIQSMRGEATASELAERFDVSERSVVNIWQEDAIKGMTEEIAKSSLKVQTELLEYGHHHVIYPEMVQMLTMKQYLQLLESREFYRAMRDAYPTNCAWGNLEEKCNRQITELLRVMGSWFGLERQKNPLTSTGVRNNDLTDLDYQDVAHFLERNQPDN